MSDETLVGQTLNGKFKVVEMIATGGMGAVYAAEKLPDGGPVALKVLHAHLAKDEGIVERFRREAFTANAIGDRHIVEIYDLLELDDGAGYFISMELLDGLDLGQLIRREGPLPIARATRIARQICRAVEAAHNRGIVHRDLKPENVFLVEENGEEDFVKVLDFGVAKLLQAIEGVEAPTATKTGTALGTPHYMAPEQAQGIKGYDHRVDVYALGVILFRMLTGQHPFDDESLPMLILKICTDPPPPVRTWRGDVSPDLERVIARMLEKDPDARYASMEEARKGLAPFELVELAPENLNAPSTLKTSPRVLSDRRVDSDEAHAPTEVRSPARTERWPRDDEEDPPPPAPGGQAAGAKWILIAAGLALAGLLLWAAIGAFNGDDAVDEQVALAELPEPREPVTRPMVSTSGGGFGWTWVNPRPRAMPPWYAVDRAAGGESVVMVGRRGAVMAHRQAGLFSWQSGTEEDLLGVAFTGARQALAVGVGGTIIRLRPDGATPVPNGVDTTLRAVVALSATEALVVGDEGVLLRVIGDRVTQLDIDTDADLLGLFARGGVAYASGSEGTILRIDGRRVSTERVPTRVALRGIAGCAEGDLYAVGDDAMLLRRRSNGQWRQLRVTRSESFNAVSCDHGRIAAVTRDGRVLLVSGNDTVELPSELERAWYAVAGGQDGSSWVVGAGGRIATIESNHLRTRTAGPTVPISALGEMGGSLVAVGHWGRILRERETGLVRVDSPTDSGLGDLIQIDEGRLVAVGDHGTLLDIRYDRATELPSPFRFSLRAGVAAGEQVLIVGASGAVLRGTLSDLRSSTVPDVGDLHDLAGTPTDAYAVGDDGVVLRFREEGAIRIACGSTRLRAVMIGPDSVFAAGDNGRIVRVDQGCALENTGGEDLYALALGPNGRPIAGGDNGVVLERNETGQWAPASVNIEGQSVRAIWRGARYVYLAGTGGFLVRHIIVDGSR